MNEQRGETSRPPFPTEPPYTAEEIDLRELFSVIWVGKWIILIVTALFAISALVYAINQPNIYKAQVLLAPSSTGNSGGVSAMARQFGGLASLAGISLGGGSSGDKSALAIEVIKSRQFISNFVKKYDLLVPLLAANGWNQDANELLIDPEIYDERAGEWVRQAKSSITSEPTLWEAHKEFSEILSVVQAKDSGLVTVSIEHFSPYLAREWVELLVKDLNAEMKQKDVGEAKSSIAFLTGQLENTQITEMQNVFYQLIEEQTKTIMLSEVREEYVFTTVDPAVVPEEKSKPKRALVVVIGTMLGMMLSIIFVVGRGLVKR